MSVVPLAEAKTHLNFRSDTDDVELQAFLDDAETVLTRHVGPLAQRTVTERHNGGADAVLLQQWPVVSVTSVTYATGGSIPVTADDLDAEAGILHLPFAPAYGKRSLIVTYQAGRTTLPGDLRRAVLELTRHLWRTQRGSAPSRRDPDAFDPSLGRLLPPEVEQLIEPHRTAPAVA